MDFRQMIGQHPGVAAAIAVVIAAVAVWRFAVPNQSQQRPAQWFFDTQSGELFQYEGDELPPISTATGSEAVKAYVFANGDCTQSQNRDIAYLEKWTEAGKAYMKNPGMGAATTGADGKSAPLQLVAVPDEQDELQWFDAASDAGRNTQAREKQFRDQGMIDCDWH